MMEIENAQEAFVNLLGQIKPESKLKFLEWVCREYNPDIESGRGHGIIEEESDEPGLLEQIALDLRNAVPLTALAPGEEQIFHASSQMKGMSASNTLHVDSFLYPTDDDVDYLCGEQLQIGRHYCLSCGAWKTAPLNFISHSLSKDQLNFVFTSLIPDLNGKVVVDIGSRIGSVLYCCYAYSRASKIVGIENRTFFVELGQQVVARYNLSERIEWVSSDVCHQGPLLQSADLIIFNNVFEFISSLEEQARIWEYLYLNVRKRGTLMVTVPSIQESCRHLTFKVPLHLEEWMTEVPTGVDSQDEELRNIHLYCVI